MKDLYNRLKVKEPSTLLIVAALLLLVSSCSFDYESANIQEALDENVPDIVLEDAKLVFVRGTAVTISADRIEIFSNQKQQNLFNVRFKEEATNKEIRMVGSAKQISIETDTHNITMVGEVFARSHKDEAEITTEYLKWNDKERKIQGSAISPVTILKDIGSKIEGYGFLGDAEKRELTMSGKTDGKLVVDE